MKGIEFNKSIQTTYHNNFIKDIIAPVQVLP